MSSQVHGMVTQDNSQMEAETLESRSDKKSRGKVPKKVHKAEREKMKREHFNDLFLELANSLELSEQQNGKASVLTDATRMIKDMISQIESLRKENAALTSEAEDVTAEKKEVEEETLALGSHVIELKNEIEKMIKESQIDLNAAPIPMNESSSTMQGIYVIPVCSAPGIYPDPGLLPNNPNNNYPESIVCKPRPRYLSPRDAWPSQILEKHAESN